MQGFRDVLGYADRQTTGIASDGADQLAARKRELETFIKTGVGDEDVLLSVTEIESDRI